MSVEDLFETGTETKKKENGDSEEFSLGELSSLEGNAEDNSVDRCPKCTAVGPPYVVVLVLIHILIPDPNGKLVGQSQTRYRVACDPNRDYSATFTNKEAATGDPASSNCPGCVAEARRVKYTHQMAGAYVTGSAEPALV